MYLDHHPGAITHRYPPVFWLSSLFFLIRLSSAAYHRPQTNLLPLLLTTTVRWSSLQADCRLSSSVLFRYV